MSNNSLEIINNYDIYQSKGLINSKELQLEFINKYSINDQFNALLYFTEMDQIDYVLYFLF